MTSVAEPTNTPDEPVVVDFDQLSEEQLADLFEQMRRRFSDGEAQTPTAIQALMRVMRDVQAIGKDGEFREERNGQPGRVRYRFRGVDAVMQAVGPALRRHQLLPVPFVEDVRQSEYTTKGGTRMRETVTTVTYRIYGPLGDYVEARMAGEAGDAGDKSVSKAESVGYRMLWLQLLCIPTDEPDPDLLNYERGSTQDQAATRESQQSSRQELITTVTTLSTQLRDLLGIGEYEWLEWMVKVCHKDFGANIVKVQHDGGPVEEIDLATLRNNQLQLLHSRLSNKLDEERKARRAEKAMDLEQGS